MCGIGAEDGVFILLRFLNRQSAAYGALDSSARFSEDRVIATISAGWPRVAVRGVNQPT